MEHELLRKYFAQDCSETELKEIYAYFSKHPERMQDFFPQNEWAEIVREKVPTHIRQERRRAVLIGSHAVRKLILPAAAVIIVLLGLFIVLRFSGSTLNQQLAGSSLRENSSRSSPGVITLVNSGSGLKKIFLEDRSVVELAPGSSIYYRKGFTQHQRFIYLKGSATFSVAKDPEKPFIVFCNNVTTTAIGTVFKVSSDGKYKVSVKLIEGKVKVRSSKNNGSALKDHYLAAGSTLLVDLQNNSFSTLFTASSDKTPAPDDGLSQSQEKTGKLYFDNEPLSKVLDRLSAIYNIKIEYSPKQVLPMRFVGSFQNDERLNDVLEHLCLMTNLNLTIDSLSGKAVYRISSNY